MDAHPRRPARRASARTRPRIETLQITRDKIGALIGPGGKTIKGITAETGAEINIEDDGTVHIYSNNGRRSTAPSRSSRACTKEIEVGETYRAASSPSRSSALRRGLPRQGRPGPHLRTRRLPRQARRGRRQDGRSHRVKCIGVDDKGRVKLSRKAALREEKAAEAEAAGVSGD